MSERWYRVLLNLLLPRGFRREYGEFMAEAFRSMLRDRRRSRASTWWLVLRDLAVTAGREWRTSVRSTLQSLVSRRFAARLATVAREVSVRGAGLAALAGAAGWFVLFIGPQWSFVEDLGWGRNGLGYRPWGIVTASLLLAGGLGAWALVVRGTTSRLRLAGLGVLVATVLLVALQAPGPMGGVGFDPARGVGVHLLPFAVSLLALEWGPRGSRDPRIRTVTRTLPGLVTAVVAAGLLVPALSGWLDQWAFVLRHAFIFPVLALALHAAYDLLGGPRLEVRVRPREARATA